MGKEHYCIGPDRLAPDVDDIVLPVTEPDRGKDGVWSEEKYVRWVDRILPICYYEHKVMTFTSQTMKWHKQEDNIENLS